MEACTWNETKKYLLDVCVQCLPCRMIDPKLIQVYHVDEAKCVKMIIGWSTWTHPKWHPSDWASKAAIAASLNTSTAFSRNVEKLACRFLDTAYTCICTNTFRVAWNILTLNKMFGITPWFSRKSSHVIVRGKTLGIICKYNSEIRLYITFSRTQ